MIQERIEDGIIIATFDNGKANTITLETLRQLKSVVAKANSDDSILGIVLTGEGRAFSSGFDLPMFLDFKDLDEVVEFFNEEEEILLDLFMCKKPVVSAINGAAVAGGLITAMASDYRIIKNHPKVVTGMSEIKIGLGLSIAQTEILRFSFDSNKLFQDVMYWGKIVNAETAHSMGFIEELAEEDTLLPRAKEVVTQWSSGPGEAFSMLKESIRQPAAMLIRDRLKNENWQEKFNIFFDPGTRQALEMVQAMMSK